MNRREVLKLFLASQIPLGGLLERLAVAGESKAVECKIDGWDMRFNERSDLGFCIQVHASKKIHGTICHFAVMFDKEDKIERMRAIMESQLKQIERRKRYELTGKWRKE